MWMIWKEGSSPTKYKKKHPEIPQYFLTKDFVLTQPFTNMQTAGNNLCTGHL